MRLTIFLFCLSLLLCCNNPTSEKKDTDSAIANIPATHISPDSLKKEMAEEIESYIKGGFYDKDETFQNIQEVFEDELLDTNWIKEEIGRQYNYRLSEQKTWEKVTDFDRLAMVFDKLNSSGIIALHKAGYTRTDGEEDTEDLHEQLKGKGIKTRGYCFYHEQDVGGALAVENLYLAFGDFDQNDKAAIEIGNEIISALHEKGFKTNWNGSIAERIEIVKMRWQKRFENDNCSNERAFSLLSK